ncbi:MAG: cytochrome C oxidase subunit IV family protein [Candidatus Sericytochromatia bacterium]
MSNKTASEHPVSPFWTDGVWLLLLPLTLLSYFFAENGQNALITPIVLGIAALKALLIGLEFMELKRMPWGFGLMFGVFFVGLALGLIVLLQR